MRRGRMDPLPTLFLDFRRGWRRSPHRCQEVGTPLFPRIRLVVEIGDSAEVPFIETFGRTDNSTTNR